MGGIRSFEESDIERVVALREQCFGASSQHSADDKAAYFRDIFFHSPWADPQCPSLVFEDRKGELTGFLGALVRPIVFQGQTLSMAVATQLMSAPDRPGMSGLKLMKAFLDGPQALSMADSTAPGARIIWQRLGGHVAELYSLNWLRPLRPHLHARGEFGAPGAAKLLSRALAPINALQDRLLAANPQSRFYQQPTTLNASELGTDGFVSVMSALQDKLALSPHYTSESASWLMPRLEPQDSGATLRAQQLTDPEGQAVGWYLYIANPGATGQVLQVGADGSNAEAVLQHLNHDAWQQGCLAVSGRVQPELLPLLAKAPGMLRDNGPCTAVHARDPELLNTVLRGEAWLTRLEGEWWLRF